MVMTMPQMPSRFESDPSESLISTIKTIETIENDSPTWKSKEPFANKIRNALGVLDTDFELSNLDDIESLIRNIGLEIDNLNYQFSRASENEKGKIKSYNTSITQVKTILNDKVTSFKEVKTRIE
jgi:hypothetical protein